MLRSTALSCVLTLLTIGTASAQRPIPEAPTVAVVVMRLAGDPTVAEEIRMQLRGQLEASGFLPRGFALELARAAAPTLATPRQRPAGHAGSMPKYGCASASARA